MLTDDFTVAKDGRFFLALCKYKTHSFVNAGIILKEGTKLLASFGKASLLEPSCINITQTLFASSEARIQNEPLIGNGIIDPTEITYKGYEINYTQYVEFLQYIKQTTKNQRGEALKAYCPHSENNQGTTLRWQSLKQFHDIKCEMDSPNNHQQLNFITNSCRHSAIALTQQGTKLKQLGHGVSSFFFKDLPLTATLETDSMGPEETLLLLPLPPEAYTTSNPALDRVLKRLYKRLDEFTASQQSNPLTKQKFLAIKTLYQSLTQHQPACLKTLLDSLQTWVTDNAVLIGSHRKNHWISFPTATENLFNCLLNDVASARI